MADTPVPVSPELEKKLAGIDREVRKYLGDVALWDLWWDVARSWEMDLSDVDEMLPVSLLREEARLRQAVEDAVGDSEAARDILGHARVYAGEKRNFGILFGLALGQAVTLSRTYPPDADEPTLADSLTASQVLECWFEASQAVDRFVRHPAESEETISEVDTIVARKVFGPPRE